MPEVVHTGLVKWYSGEKGYGFIHVDGLDKDVFMHIKELRASGISGLMDGEKLTFECKSGPKGLFATKISRVSANGGAHAASIPGTA